jgi:hypothetical protein
MNRAVSCGMKFEEERFEEESRKAYQDAILLRLQTGRREEIKLDQHKPSCIKAMLFTHHRLQQLDRISDQFLSRELEQLELDGLDEAIERKDRSVYVRFPSGQTGTYACFQLAVVE